MFITRTKRSSNTLNQMMSSCFFFHARNTGRIGAQASSRLNRITRNQGQESGDPREINIETDADVRKFLEKEGIPIRKGTFDAEQADASSGRRLNYKDINRIDRR